VKPPGNEREALVDLAESLEGKSKKALGPGLLDEPAVRLAFLESWWRAWLGSKEDIAAMARIGKALVALKHRALRGDDPLGERMVADHLRRLDVLIPRDETKAAKFRDREVVGSAMARARKGRRFADERALWLIFDRPDVLGVLLDARAHRPARGFLPYRIMARRIARPVEPPEDAGTKMRSEQRQRQRAAKPE
jgi:hypothetical protein